MAPEAAPKDRLRLIVWGTAILGVIFTLRALGGGPGDLFAAILFGGVFLLLLFVKHQERKERAGAAAVEEEEDLPNPHREAYRAEVRISDAARQEADEALTRFHPTVRCVPEGDTVRVDLGAVVLGYSVTLHLNLPER